MIIFNTDDFGFSTTENMLIDEVIQHNIVKSVSLMANFAINEISSSSYNNTSIGFHMNLVEGPSFTKPLSFTDDGNFIGKKAFLKRYVQGKINKEEVRKEIDSQLKFILDCGFKISHGDSHQSLHSFPFVFHIYEDILKQYGIIKIRNTVSLFNWFGDKNVTKAYLQNVFSRFTTKKSSLKSPDFVLVGCPGLGNENVKNINDAIKLWDVALARNYRNDIIVEVPCHLGLSNLEYELYKSQDFLELLKSHKVQIGNYYDI